MAKRKYEYHVTSPMLPPEEERASPETPVMDYRDLEYWLNSKDEQGWEFVGFSQKHWIGSEPFIQEWWVFRRPVS